ncbi:hypothetical protein WICPIJ_007216 [Wickerhamomyces pijperi]|uniref:Uncharacterized protein n=1 Tax=Wickerhamomyces pijperi TaxID=599730 RepID=A0A9P8Q089_WICPI|nr:hypothetical protein WICPIJ_007216 [Wickerhamomyces pijperi]
MVSSSNTRKSTRTRVLTSKAKQYQIDSKPVLRSISVIDEDENAYNGLTFKKRRMNPISEQSAEQPQQQQPEPKEQQQEEESSSAVKSATAAKSFQYNSNIDNDDEDNESAASDDEESVLVQMSSVTKFESDGSEISSQSDEDFDDDEDLFNSDEDNEYYSAISDYENDTKPKFNDVTLITRSKFLTSVDFFKNKNQSVPNCELKSLEENFQKIIDEHKSSTPVQSTPTTPISTAFPTFTSSDSLSIDDFVDYSDHLIDDSEPSSPCSSSSAADASTSKSSRFLQYRHDEKHNLAFPDVSTFPIRFDPTATAGKSNGSKGGFRGKKIRALNRRAILSGKASEMVGTGISNFGEFTF